MQLRSGETKKKGAGGKFTWGSVLSEAADGGDSAALDRNDPNYDSEEEASRAASAAQARAAAADDGDGDVPAALPGTRGIVQAVSKLKGDVRPHACPLLCSKLWRAPRPLRAVAWRPGSPWRAVARMLVCGSWVAAGAMWQRPCVTRPSSPPSHPARA